MSLAQPDRDSCPRRRPTPWSQPSPPRPTARGRRRRRCRAIAAFRRCPRHCCRGRRDIRAVLDHADMAAHIARQARVRRRGRGAGTHPVAGLEARRRVVSRAVGPPRASIAPTSAARSTGRCAVAGCSARPAAISSSPTRPRSRISCSESGEPDLVVAHGEIGVGRTIFRAKRDMSMLQPPGLAIASVNASVRRSHPAWKTVRRVRHDRPESARAAHVVRAVHQIRSFGCAGSPVPIMLSRVTRSASWASLQPSVPAGRRGSTR